MFLVVPLNRSTLHSSIPHLHINYTSNLKKFYLVTWWLHLMQPLKANLHWKMKVRKVEVRISMCPLLSDMLPGYTMFPAMRTSLWPSNTMQHGYQPVLLQTCPMQIILQYLWWLRQFHSRHSISFLNSTTTETHEFFTILQVHPYHMWQPRWWRRGRGFQTVSLGDDHWNTEEIPDRYLCIHKHSVPHELCPHPCPNMNYTSSSYYNTLDLIDISEFEDLMTASSNEDVPVLNEDLGYWSLWTMVNKCTFTFNLHFTYVDKLLFNSASDTIITHFILTT